MTRSWWRLAAALVAVKAAALALDHRPWVFLGDSMSYLETARSGWIPPDRSYTYGWLVGALGVRAGSLVPLLAAQACAGVVSALVVAWLVRAGLGAPPAVAAAAGLAVALEPCQLLWERAVMAESTATCAFLLMVAAGWKAIRSGRLRWLLAAQLAGFAAVSLRTSFLPAVAAAALLVPLAAWRAAGRPDPAPRLLLHLAASLAACLVLDLAYARATGLLSGCPPTNLPSAPLFLLGDASPLLVAGDFRDPELAKALLPVRYASDPARANGRELELWAPDGLVARLVARQGLEAARRTAGKAARRAVLRDPRGFLALALGTWTDLVRPVPWRARARIDCGLDRPLDPGELGMLAAFGADGSRNHDRATLTTGLYLMAFPWMVLALHAALVLGAGAVVSPGRRRCLASLAGIAAAYTATVLVLGPAPIPRYLHPLGPALVVALVGLLAPSAPEQGRGYPGAVGAPAGAPGGLALRTPDARGIARLLAALMLAPALGAAPQGDWKDELTGLLQAYLRLDTSNPPGREELAAGWLRDRLGEAGIDCRLLPVAPGRPDLVAWIPGTGKKRPVVLLHHMDVVPADAAHWAVPPFAGTVKDGYVWGRGAVDIKGKGIVDLMTMLRIRRERIRLDRDVILLAVADEEVNSIGAQAAAGRYKAFLHDAEYVIDEGGGARADARGEPGAWLVAVGSKSPLWLKVRFPGEAGHGSVPDPDSSVARAVRAAARLLAEQRPLHLVPEAVGYLKYMCRGRDLRSVAGYAGSMEASVRSPAFLAALAADREINALLRDTVTITQLGGSDKINTIPNEAYLGLDCRLLPDTDRAGFMKWLKGVLGDPGATLAIEEQYGADPGSPVDSGFMKTLAAMAARRAPPIPLVPMLLTSSTDSYHFRKAGMKAYGFEPYAVSDEDLDRAHGNDERIPVGSLAPAVELQLELLRGL